MEQEFVRFVDTYAKAIKENNAAIFAGAGLSAAAGFVNWKELMREIAADLRLTVDKENDLVAIAQYHFNEYGNNRHKLNQKLIEEFTSTAKLSTNHTILASLPIQSYWTTNYDKLIEKSLEMAGKTPDIKIRPTNLANNLPKRDAIVYKMHGDVQFPDEAILTKDDYETYNEKRELFSIALRGDLVSKTFLFVGFSFDDPNLEYILSRIRVLLGQSQRIHFCFFRRLEEKDFKDKEDYQYAVIRQELKTKDLRRYGISALWIDSYDQITEVLQAIEKKIKKENVFISGAADTYEPIDQAEATAFLHKLSYAIASSDFRIICGFGTGVGSSIINGALDFKLSTNYRHLDDLLILRPFPQTGPGDKSKEQSWTDYRKNMLQNAGIAIYIFGNKMSGTTLGPSTGMIEEFEIASSLGVYPVPIGATGFVAEEIWRKVIANPSDYYPNEPKLLGSIEQLGNKKLTCDELIAETIKAIKLLRDEV